MISVRVSIAAAVGAVLLLALIFELIRRRRLQERYALLWLATGIAVLVLAIWHDALEWIARASGGGGGGFLSTHPATRERIAALEG